MCNYITWNLFITFWSLEEVVGDLRNHVRSSVQHFFKNRPLLFSETFQLVRACKRDQNFPSAFLKKSCFAHIVQKLTKIGHFCPKYQKLRFFLFFRNPFIRIDFLVRRRIRKNLEFSPRSFVRSCATHFLRILLLLFF